MVEVSGEFGGVVEGWVVVWVGVNVVVDVWVVVGAWALVVVGVGVNVAVGVVVAVGVEVLNMIAIGFKELSIASLKLPGNWRQILDDPSIKDRAESIKTFTQLQEPIVRRSDMLLISGRRRVAAHVYLGLAVVYCKLVDCTDDEAEAISHVENAHREHDAVKQKADMLELVALTTKIEETRRAAPDAPVQRKKAKTVAMEIVADSIGLTPGAVRQAEYRERIRRSELKKQRRAELSVKNLGLEFDEDFKAKLELVAELVHMTSMALVRATALMSQLKSSGAPLHEDRLAHVRQELSLLTKTLRGLKPSSLCPYCKGVEQIMTGCTACIGTGYITASQEAGVPQELWDESEPKVVLQGKMFPLNDFLSDSVDVTPEAVVAPEEEDIWA